ncbi:MAG: pantoate--beta-alanine ligase [Planctomycetota bacterium]
MRVVRHFSQAGDQPTVLVPTMGALHPGHTALIERGAAIARERGLAGGCVVSIFVNPTQFDDPSDLDRYPRILDEDAAMCEQAGASAVWAPEADEIYPGDEREKLPPLPLQATEPGLEDKYRPGHPTGVCQVCARLFEIVKPAAAVFGEKDWQQLVMLTELSKTIGGPEIIGHPTIREPDGLAMASRNRFLTKDGRARARAVPRAIELARQERDPDRAEAVMQDELLRAGLTIDYAVVRDAFTLQRPVGTEGRVLITARAGSVRLLDNAPWPG